MAVGPVLSLAVVKPQFAQYVQKVESMLTDAKAIDVSDDETLKFSVALGGEAKKIAKAIEAKRKDVTAEASDFVDSVNSFCKMFVEKLVLNPKKTNGDSIEAVLKNKITSYQSRIELERRKQEEAARKAAAELQAKLDAEAAEVNRKAQEEAARKAEEDARKRKAGEAEIEAARKAAAEEAAKHEVQAPTVMAPAFEKTNNVTRTETGTSSYQAKTWKCYVERPELVPREFCLPDGRLLNQAVKQGVREIPGCKIVEESDTRFRT
jgi:hypothetical protein